MSIVVCDHFIGLEPVAARTRGCEECLKIAVQFVHEYLKER